MKRVCLVIAAALAATAFTVGPVRSSESASPGQDQSAKPKEEEKSKTQEEKSKKEEEKGKDKDDSAKKVSGPLGAKTNPVRCEDPSGERQYLSRLRCPDGKRPLFSRIGSFGLGPYGNIIDGYSVRCEGREDATIFMDMYHEGYVEKEAVPGFTIVDAENRPQARLTK